MEEQSEKDQAIIDCFDNHGNADDEESSYSTLNAYAAAKTLYSFHNEELDEAAAATLRSLIIKFFCHIVCKPPDLPPLPSDLAQAIGECCELPLQKPLTETDLNDHQIRLSLSKSHVQEYFIPMLKEEDGNVNNGIQVTTYDSEGNGYEMRFVLWGGKMYVLTSPGWKQFYKDHELETIHMVSVWMFRSSMTGKLCFAITWRSTEEILQIFG